jgi:hypothetical protein
VVIGSGRGEPPPGPESGEHLFSNTMVPISEAGSRPSVLPFAYNTRTWIYRACPRNWTRKRKSVVIETPKGRRNKFDYDPKIESFTLGGLLPDGLSFPFDFGFVPSTLAEDGDPWM